MLKQMAQKINIFCFLYNKTLSLFFLHIYKFLFFSLIFTFPFFFVDSWLYYNEFSLKSRNIYFSLDMFFNGVALVFFLWCLLVHLLAIMDADKNQKIGIIAIFQKVPRLFFSFVYVQFLSLIKVLLWGLLLIIPGVLFFFIYSFSGWAFLVDGKKGPEALTLSKQIVVGRLNSFFDVLILFVIFQGAVSFPLYLLINQAHRFFYVSSHFFAASIVDYLILLWMMLNCMIVQIFFYYLYGEVKISTEED